MITCSGKSCSFALLCVSFMGVFQILCVSFSFWYSFGFGTECKMRDVIVSIPGHCFSF